VANIERRVLHLTDLLTDRLRERGYRASTSTRPEERSGIVVFARQLHDSEELLQKLTEKKVVVSLRDGAICASARQYSTEEDVERLVEALPK
jgi:selenocysteine lyase/cysteine desulfurase